MNEVRWAIRLHYEEGSSGILFSTEEQARAAFEDVASGMGNPHLNFNLIIEDEWVATYNLEIVKAVELIEITDLAEVVIDSASSE